MPTTLLNLLQQLSLLIQLNTTKNAGCFIEQYSDDAQLDWEKILTELINVMNSDYISRQILSVQLQKKDLSIKELHIELKNLRRGLREQGQMKFELEKHIDENKNLKKQLSHYKMEFKEIEAEFKCLQELMPSTEK